MTRGPSGFHYCSFAAILLVLVVMVWYNFNNKFWNKPDGVVKHDIISYYSYLPAAIIHNDLSFRFTDQDRSFFSDKIWTLETVDGKRYQKMTMGLSFMYAPFFMLGHIIAPLLGSEPNGYSRPYMFLLQFSALFYLLLALIVLRNLMVKRFGDGVTAMVLLSIVFGTNLFYYASREAAMPHAYNFFLFACFIWLTIKWHERHKWIHTIALGLVSGLILLIRPSNAVIAVFFILYDVKSWKELLQRPMFLLRNAHHILLILFCAALVILPQFLYWKAFAGSYFIYTYGDEGFFFGQPQIINGLFSFRKGWLIYTPLMALALAGIAVLHRYHRNLTIPVIVFTGINIYVIFSWWCWWYGGSFGARAMIESYALLAFPLAAFVRWSLERKTWIKNTFIALILLFSFYGIYQTTQYYYGAIHWDSMTRGAWIHSLGRIRPGPEFEQLIEAPDYEKAKKGIQAVMPKLKRQFSDRVFFDFESIDESGKYFISDDDLYLAQGAKNQTDEYARSGKYSLKINPEHPYQGRFDFFTQVGEKLRVSAWFYPATVKSVFVFSAPVAEYFYKVASKVHNVEESGWAQLAIEITIPEGEMRHFVIYFWNQDDLTVYFDDFEVVRIE